MGRPVVRRPFRWSTGGSLTVSAVSGRGRCIVCLLPAHKDRPTCLTRRIRVIVFTVKIMPTCRAEKAGVIVFRISG